MKKLCFGALATVLVQCMAPTTTQKQLVGSMLLSVNERYDIQTDDGTTSALARGHVNLSDEVTVYAKQAEVFAIAADCEENEIITESAVLHVTEHRRLFGFSWGRKNTQ